MSQRRVIECEKISATIERKPREVLYIAPQILREIMQRPTCCADGRGAILQPETIQRCDLEMIAHGVKRGLGRKGPVIVTAQYLKRAAQHIAHGSGFGRQNDFRRTQAL